MVPRRILVLLVYGLPILIVAFAVLMGGGMLAQALGDTVGARVLQWVAVACLMLIVTDLVLLVGALGINSLVKAEEPRDES